MERLGRGGFADVFRAYDGALGRDVALKVLLPHLAEDDDVRQRFLQEARAMARLRHPHIVTVFDVGEADGRPFFAMELVEGETLAARLARETFLDPATALTILQPLASALDYLHGAGIIHRDLKPANVMLGRTGRVMLMDFGIARMQDSTRHTSTGIMMGTPEYMAPEQFTGGQPVGPWTDVYALGVMTYHMLAGRPPFTGDTARVLFAHAGEPPPPLSAVRPGLPTPCYEAIERALHKAGDARPPSASAFVALFMGRPLPAVDLPPAPPVPTIATRPPSPSQTLTASASPAPPPALSTPLVTIAGTRGDFPILPEAAKRPDPTSKAPRTSRRTLLALGAGSLGVIVAGGAAALLARGGPNDTASGGAPPESNTS